MRPSPVVNWKTRVLTLEIRLYEAPPVYEKAIKTARTHVVWTPVEGKQSNEVLLFWQRGRLLFLFVFYLSSLANM